MKYCRSLLMLAIALFTTTNIEASPAWTGIVVHHSATPSSTTFESIRRYHVEEKGWDDIGYNFIINSNGRIRKGRPLNQPGAHALNPAPSRNRTHIGICIIGNSTATRSQLQSLALLLKKLESRFSIPASAIEHHHEKCPGKTMWNQIKEAI